MEGFNYFFTFGPAVYSILIQFQLLKPFPRFPFNIFMFELLLLSVFPNSFQTIMQCFFLCFSVSLFLEVFFLSVCFEYQYVFIFCQHLFLAFRWQMVWGWLRVVYYHVYNVIVSCCLFQTEFVFLSTIICCHCGLGLGLNSHIFMCLNYSC